MRLNNNFGHMLPFLHLPGKLLVIIGLALVNDVKLSDIILEVIVMSRSHPTNISDAF